MSTLQATIGSRGSSSLQYFHDGLGEANGDGIAPWFKPERFTEPDFSAEAFIAELRRSVPLEALSQELEAYLTTLKSKLVEVINEDYNDFVSLSSRLVNVDGAVLRMQRPLQEVSEKLAAVGGSLQGELEALGQGLRRRQETAAARALLELMQDTAHVMAKVEKLLAEVEAAEEEEHSLAGEALDGRARMLERLASEVSRLNYYSTRGKELPFVQQLEPRMAAAREKLQLRLAAALKLALLEKHASARQHCLLGYAAIADAAGAEKVVRDALVRPLVAGVLSRFTSAGPRTADTFPQVLIAILEEVGREVGPLVQITVGAESGLQSFDFLGSSVLAEVDAALAESLSGAISPGVPATFLTNYRAGMNFLEGLESHCSSQAALTALREGAAYQSFMRRWKLSIYFSTRFQEIAGAFENSLSAPDLRAEAGAEDTLAFQLLPSEALHACLKRVVAPEVILRPLTDKFSRLAMQLLARYTSWLKQGTSATESAPDTTSDGQDGWGHSTPVELLACARADLDTLDLWLRGDYVRTLSDLTAFMPAQVSDGIRTAFLSSVEDVSAQASPITAGITTQIANKCAAGLVHLRGITATYRMNTRPLPSRPSHYVSGILQALAAFLDTQAARSLQDAARLEVAEGVVSEVARRYMNVAVELLETLRKTESSLKRIRQGRAGDAATAGGPSDIDKISLQHFLDVQEVGRQASKFGVQADQLPAYQDLWRAVAPADRAEQISLS